MVSILMGFAKPAMPQGTSHDCCALFGQFLGSEASQNKEGGVPPHPPSKSSSQKHGNFWGSRRVRGVILTVFTMFFARA